VVFYCHNTLEKRSDIFAKLKKVTGFKVRLRELPCSSKIEVPHLLKILESGVDGIEVIGCPEMLCELLLGNARADKRIMYTRGLLEKINLGAERVGMDRGVDITAADLIALAKKRADLVRRLGPNPMKNKNHLNKGER
jgi:coenzyme F420-reducing hydrogenase delta subunit